MQLRHVAGRVLIWKIYIMTLICVVFDDVRGMEKHVLIGESYQTSLEVTL